jgi:anti-sigma regulatory factor (Ser/Thr protein kinase)
MRGQAAVAELAQARVSRLRHTALPYASPGEFAAGVARFVESAVQAGGPVLVACAGPGLDLLRPRLNGHAALVTWADMRSIGVNPARLIDMIQQFTGQHRGRVTWCVQEPAWAARSPEELREVIRHEALVNRALADMPVSVLCPYDIRLGAGLIVSVERTHPALTGGGRRWRSSSYVAGMVPQECDLPLSTPPAAAQTLRYRDDLAGVRDFAASRARRVGLAAHRVGDLIVAVGELAANTFAHTSGPGTLTLWATLSEIICQVNDTGQITDPLAGRIRRDPATARGGHGLWVVQQVCDLVQIRTSPAGTAIRLHMYLNSTPTEPPLSAVAEPPEGSGSASCR